MIQPSECIFCGIVTRNVPARIVYVDDRHVAFFPLEHINPGHVVLVPTEHVDYIFDMPEQKYSLLWSVAKSLAPGLRLATGAVRIAIAVEGFSVPHVHIHLVPVYSGDQLNPSRAERLPDLLAEHLANKIRNALVA